MPVWGAGAGAKELPMIVLGDCPSAVAGETAGSGTVCTVLHSGHWALRPMASRVTCSFRPQVLQVNSTLADWP
jgi:hypothetical protein